MRMMWMCLLGLICSTPALAQQHLIWWEGESPTQTNFPKSSDFSPVTFADNRDQLSGGDWLSSSAPRRGPELFAKYVVDVPAEGTYELWTRKFWNHGPFRWRIGDGEWNNVGTNMPLADNTPLRTHVCANWVDLGSVKLPAGKQLFEIRLLAEQGKPTTSAFDCFVLTDGVFVPNGKMKPGEKIGLAEPGYFAWEPGIDPFEKTALLDLRELNEPTAGEKGFVQKKGNDFALADGSPVKFWGVNCSVENVRQSPSSVAYLARKLAKAGVNLVRVHGKMWKDSDPGTLDPAIVDSLQKFVLAMKKEGIYTSISFYFPLWFDAKEEQGFAGFGNFQNKKPFALLFYNQRMQELHSSWLKQLLTTPMANGSTLAQEPAVAMIELLNEDSMFFWTFSKKNIPPAQWDLLQKQYDNWLTKKYGSLEKAGNSQLQEIYALTRDAIKGNPDRAKRAGDQSQFMAELQRDFYKTTIDRAQKEWGAKSLFLCSNWITADAWNLDAIERWTNTVGEVIESHGYFGGKHTGDGSGYSVRVGHQYQDAPAVLTPRALPIRFMNVEGFPMRISEVGWTTPNRFRADATLLVGAYGALQGLDAMDWFIVGSNYLNDGPGGKFNVSYPTIFSTFPACAYLYRKGLIREGPDVVHAAVSPDELFTMKGSAAAEQGALDDLREKDIPPDGKLQGPVNRFDPLAFYVGRVVREYGDASKSSQMDLRPFLKPGVIESATKELNWNYQDGIVRVNAPAAQGITGFLKKAGRVEFSDLSITSANEYGQIILVALDNKPISESKKMLLQVMTEDKAYGERVAGGTIQSLGTSPIGVKEMVGELQFKGAIQVQALDENGYARGEAKRLEDGKLNFDPRVVHYLVSR